MRLSLGEIAQVLGVSSSDPTVIVSGIAVDSRKVKQDDLFCAVIGANADGHDYLGDAASRGAAAALVTRPVLGYLPVVEVPEIDVALAKIASLCRSRFAGPVMGITGSVGKTTVKEFIAAALSSFGPVLKSHGNQNTEYGVPMTLMGLEDQHQFAVLEMGMRGQGQIAHLCEFVRPTIGVITRIGTAHIGELGSQEAIANAKAELIESLPADGVAILPNEDTFFTRLRDKAKCKVLSFGSNGADVNVLNSKTDFEHSQTVCTIAISNDRFEVTVPGLGSQQANNAAAALAVVHALGLPIPPAIESLRAVEHPTNRLESIRIGGTVLVDVYNSSPESCLQALQLLKEYPAAGERIAVLGDMLELGEFSEGFHRQIGAEVARLGIDRLAVIGRDSHWIRDEAIAQGFEGRVDSLGTVELAAKLISSMSPDDVLLIKASRGLALERAVEIAEKAYA